MFQRNTALAALALAASAGIASAAPVVNGQRDAQYGLPVSVQQNFTGFGDSNLGQVGPANGSELDAAYGVVEGGFLYLFLAGNLESNFNKIEIFFDTVPGGQNKLRGDNANVDFNGLNRMGDDGSGNGLQFDPGFTADFFLSASGNGTDLFANYATLPTLGGGLGFYLGQTTYGSGGVLSGGSGPSVLLTIDNSNTAGVTGSSGTGGELVTTGIEIRIPLADIGNPPDFIHICAFINGTSHDFVSNQSLGPMPFGTANPGEPRLLNFAQIAGDQFFTVIVPEPSAVGLLGMGIVGVLGRRRRST